MRSVKRSVFGTIYDPMKQTLDCEPERIMANPKWLHFTLLTCAVKQRPKLLIASTILTKLLLKE